jgi:hypothetical protein
VDWKGKRIQTIGDLMDALAGLKDKDEARAFMILYRRFEPQHAAANVGYVCGYFDSVTSLRLQEWCETAHPIFGRRTPTPEEAFEAGRIAGERARAQYEAEGG